MTNNYWSLPVDELFRELQSSVQGLSLTEAEKRLKRYGSNELRQNQRHGLLRLFVDRFRSPLLLILVFAAVFSIVLRDWVNAYIVLGIVFMSAIISTILEHRASSAVEKLRNRVSARSTVRRESNLIEVPSASLVSGDIVILTAGSLIPADGVIIEAVDCYVSQAILTGETFPVMKMPGAVPENAVMAERNNCVFMGTSVRSGTASMLVVQTARQTIYGQIAETLFRREPTNEFELGLKHFGTMLLRIMIIVVMSVLAIDIILQKPTVETLLFAVALSVGLSPELLPAILMLTLSHGALAMAGIGVIVRRLDAIENLGSMDVLCTDKTGTLTKGVVNLDYYFDCNGESNLDVLKYATLNSGFQTGIQNPLDDAVMEKGKSLDITLEDYVKLHEIPYDYVRKCLSIVVLKKELPFPELITKGALDKVLAKCTTIRTDSGSLVLDATQLAEIQKKFVAWSSEGYRVLGVAAASVPKKELYGRNDETALEFVGFLLFFDPPESGVRSTLEGLRKLGVRTTIITGDNHLVALHVANAVGVQVERVVTGAELSEISDDGLRLLASKDAVFAEVDPNQKELIILAHRKAGHVVGYIGDGINDLPALHAADVGISVDNAVDVAREAADFVLLKHDLELVRKGISEGRHTFANTLKYIFITTSANFGNMISLAIASIFMPFLPMLAKQVLLNNFLADIPAMGIAGDRVDNEWETTPHRWDIGFVRNFMIVFGMVSTAFDMLTFGMLWWLVGDSPALFRTGWFVETLLTQLFIILIIRTFKPFYESLPGRFLTISAIVVSLITIVLPYIPLAGAAMGFLPLPVNVLCVVLAIVFLYIMVSEFTKHALFRHFLNHRES